MTDDTQATDDTQVQGRPTDRAPQAVVPARWRWSILVLLAVIFMAVGLHQAARDAPAVDEGVDLSSGVASLVRHDLRMNPEHPPLPKALAALPALLADPVIPDTAAYRTGDWFDWSDEFVAANQDAGRLRPMLLGARAVVLVEALGCAALLYLLGRRFFGPDGGLLAAAAWLTTPYVVGLSHFAMIDIPFTLVTLAICVLLARWRERPTLGAACWLGVVLGAALSSRHTALVLVIVVVSTMVWGGRRERRQAAGSLGVTGLITLLTVWLVYRGLAPVGPSGAVAARFQGFIGAAGAGSPLSRLVTSLPLPVEWRAGFAFLDLSATDPPSSLLGHSWDGGRWWYFPASAALKLPLPLLLAVVGGWAATIRSREYRRRELAAVVVFPALVLWAFLMVQPLDRGLRLAMPVVALALVGLGGLASLLASVRGPSSGPEEALASPTAARSPFGGWRRPGARTVFAGLTLGTVVVTQMVAMAVAVPYSLAWTPPPFRPGFQWVSDANLDAGQALYEVRDWAEGKDAYEAIDSTRGLSVGSGTRSLHGVGPTEVRGWVAVGVTPLMQTRRDDLAWLRKYCPVGTLGGGSVLVYRFDAAPDPAPGPERPVGTCAGERVSRRGA